MIAERDDRHSIAKAMIDNGPAPPVAVQGPVGAVVATLAENALGKARVISDNIDSFLGSMKPNGQAQLNPQFDRVNLSALGSGYARAVGADMPWQGSAADVESDIVRPENVTFSPLRIPIWRKGVGGADLRSATQTELVVGRYLLTFKVPAIMNVPFGEFVGNYPISVQGKRCIVEKARLENDIGRLRIQIKIEQNPIPLLALIAAAAAGIGLGGWGLSEALESADKVLLDVPLAVVAVGGVAVAGLIVWKVFK